MADMDAERLQRTVDRAKADVEEAVQRYGDAMKQAKIGDGVPGIYVFERLWSDLDGELRRIHAQLIRNTIGAIQEEAVAAEKEDTK